MSLVRTSSLSLALATAVQLLPAASATSFDAIVAPGTKLEVLAEGFAWSEGPLWLTKENALLFTDVPNNVIHRWVPGATTATVFMKPAGYTGTAKRGGEPGANGLTRDPQGRLVMCEHGDRRVSRVNADGTKTTLADRYDGKRLNSPNDLCFANDGTLYFTDPPYGLEKRNDDPAKELAFCGVYMVDGKGAVTLLTKELTYPNGIALSPDEKTLYVAQSDPARAIVMAFPRNADGSVGAGTVLYDATPLVKAGKQGLPDGLKSAVDGTLFVTGPGGVLVLTPQGTLIGTIETNAMTANCAFGADGYLYMTAHTRLLRIKTLVTPAKLP